MRPRRHPAVGRLVDVGSLAEMRHFAALRVEAEFDLWPRGAIGVAYGLVVWSFLVETISVVVDSNHWLRDTSPVLHIAPVPAAAPNWTAAVWLVGLGAVAATAGIAAFGRRDLVGA